jgi:phosphoesterase RecJ-like protein
MSLSSEAAGIAHAIEAADLIYLASHEHPDGDAIGSALGLRLILQGLGKTVHLAIPDPVPARYAFLAGAESVRRSLPAEPADLAIALDCDGPERLGNLREAVLSAPLVANVDHHGGPEAFGDLQYIDPAAPATAAQVFAIARELGAKISPSAATCLYCGLATDTGGFRFTNTSPAALRLAAELVEAGADAADIAWRVFAERPLSAAVLEGRALCSLRWALDGRVLVASLSMQDFAAAGAEREWTEGIIDSFRHVKGAEVAVLLKEAEPGQWQVSLRAREADVRAVAARFGGGGHKLAAGCTVEGTLRQVESRVVAALAQMLGEGGDGA